MNGISCRKCLEFSPEEMRLYKREVQYQGCKLSSLLKARGYQTINGHIYLFVIKIFCVFGKVILHLTSAYYLDKKYTLFIRNVLQYFFHCVDLLLS